MTQYGINYLLMVYMRPWYQGRQSNGEYFMLITGPNFKYYAEYPNQTEAQWLESMAEQVIDSTLAGGFFKKDSDVSDLLWKHWDTETANTVRYVIANRTLP